MLAGVPARWLGCRPTGLGAGRGHATEHILVWPQWEGDEAPPVPHQATYDPGCGSFLLQRGNLRALASVLLCCGCHIKHHRPVWGGQAPSSKAQSPRSKCQRATLPPEAPGEGPLAASSGPRRPLAGGSTTPISASVFTPPASLHGHPNAPLLMRSPVLLDLGSILTTSA